MCDVCTDKLSSIGDDRSMPRVQCHIIRLKREELAQGGNIRSKVLEYCGALAEHSVSGVQGAIVRDVQADGVGGVAWGMNDLHWRGGTGYGEELAVCETM